MQGSPHGSAVGRRRCCRWGKELLGAVGSTNTSNAQKPGWFFLVIWGCPARHGGTKIAGWFIRENPIKMDGWGVSLWLRKPPFIWLDIIGKIAVLNIKTMGISLLNEASCFSGMKFWVGIQTYFMMGSYHHPWIPALNQRYTVCVCVCSNNNALIVVVITRIIVMITYDSNSHNENNDNM